MSSSHSPTHNFLFFFAVFQSRSIASSYVSFVFWAFASFLPSFLITAKIFEFGVQVMSKSILTEEQGRGEVVVVIVNMYSPKTN